MQQGRMTDGTATYAEERQHELRRTRMLMIDGNLAVNSRTAEGGVSARVYDGGYWGFASAPSTDDATRDRVSAKARQNAKAMARFGADKPQLAFPGGHYRGEHAFTSGRTPLTPAECVERMAELHAWCKQRYPSLKSSRFVLHDEHHAKRLATSTGSDVLNSIQRATCYIVLVAEDEHGAPVEIVEALSGKGSLADLDVSVATLAPLLDGLHEHLQAKRRAVPARGGLHTVVMAPELAGMLAHEAMGHPCEADLVLGGAVTGDLVGQRVASELMTMVDIAHTFDGEEVMIPVYADDEGMPARDAVLIDRGLLTEFMTSRETAAKLGIAATGSARAYSPHDEPLVRMRNTGDPARREQARRHDRRRRRRLPADENQQRPGRLDHRVHVRHQPRVRDPRRQARPRGARHHALGLGDQGAESVDAVSDDMYWTCSGYCGKKQLMVVSMGGPALRARAHLGGE